MGRVSVFAPKTAAAMVVVKVGGQRGRVLAQIEERNQKIFIQVKNRVVNYHVHAREM